MKTELYKVIKSINSQELTDEDKEELLKLFMITENSLIRDHIAMIFSDVNYDKAVPYILKKINDKALHNNNGTLVASVRELDIRKYFNDFVKMLLTQDYEARLWALDIIEDLLGSVSIKSKKKALQILSSYKSLDNGMLEAEYENSRLHFVNESIQMISDSLA